jgi:MinD superfamily P-loop ATPase
MKELLILSGKGGTGKTTVASAFVKLSQSGAYADCDIDAPNLHLMVSRKESPEKSDFYGMPEAVINTEKCTGCNACREHCRFGAIETIDNIYHINTFACEGCGVCVRICPENAISMEAAITGKVEVYKNDSVFVTAKLKMGSGNSGKLVTEVRQQLRWSSNNEPFAIIDGSPGIGCPVIASITGVAMVLIVAEPSLSGMNDMIRIINTARTLGPDIAVCVNKYDINTNITKEIKRYCENNKIPYLGEIPYDSQGNSLINKGQSFVDKDCEAGDAIKKIYEKSMSILLDKN